MAPRMKLSTWKAIAKKNHIKASELSFLCVCAGVCVCVWVYVCVCVRVRACVCVPLLIIADLESSTKIIW